MRSRPRRLAPLLSMVLGVTACGAQAAPSASTSTTTLVSIGAGVLGPAGLTASVYATGLPTVAALALDSDGRLWVATADYTDRSRDGLYVVTKAGATPLEVVTGLHTPLGLLWNGDSLYVTSHARVEAYSGFTGTSFTGHRTILTLPATIGEDNTIVLGSDGRMLMGVSAPCDHCTPADARSAAILSFLPDGSDVRVYASHIRAPVGLAFYPGSSDLFVTMNQRDDLGSLTPGDWLAVVKQGESWGFPSCYGQGGAVCDGVPQPVGVLDAHGAVSDVAIVTGELGSTVGTAALVAEWSDGVVKAVKLAKTSTGYAGTVTPFLAGLQRPVALLLRPSGELYVGDWGSGTIIKITVAGR